MAFLAKTFPTAFGWVAQRYQAAVVITHAQLRLLRAHPATPCHVTPTCDKSLTSSQGAELRKYGLRYDDLIDPLQNLVSCPPHYAGRAEICSCVG